MGELLSPLGRARARGWARARVRPLHAFAGREGEGVRLWECETNPRSLAVRGSTARSSGPVRARWAEKALPWVEGCALSLSLSLPQNRRARCLLPPSPCPLLSPVLLPHPAHVPHRRFRPGRQYRPAERQGARGGHPGARTWQGCMSTPSRNAFMPFFLSLSLSSSPQESTLVQALLDAGQVHVFQDWPAKGAAGGEGRATGGKGSTNGRQLRAPRSFPRALSL